MKKRTLLLKISSIVISLALIAAMALCMTSCGKEEPAPAATSQSGAKVVGEGATQFKFSVTYEDGKTDDFTVNTDQAMLGDALLDVGLISGSESEYGLMVDTVNGVKLVWETDNAYWALYIGEEYAQTGVSSTPVTAGGEYSFRYTKG